MATTRFTPATLIQRILFHRLIVLYFTCRTHLALNLSPEVTPTLERSMSSVNDILSSFTSFSLFRCTSVACRLKCGINDLGHLHGLKSIPDARSEHGECTIRRPDTVSHPAPTQIDSSMRPSHNKWKLRRTLNPYDNRNH